MPNWTLLDRAAVPGEDRELLLFQSKDQYSIKISGLGELMNTRVHDSEIALAELGCAEAAKDSDPRVMVGGLGMGFTLAAALRILPDHARINMVELIPAVVEWNRGPVGDASGHPTEDPRVTIILGDVAAQLRQADSEYDAILLDVDNGPEGLTHRSNDWLYGPDGLTAAYIALKPGGMLAIWSAGPDREFTPRLQRLGYTVSEQIVRAHRGKGARHTIWLARKH